MGDDFHSIANLIAEIDLDLLLVLRLSARCRGIRGGDDGIVDDEGRVSDRDEDAKQKGEDGQSLPERNLFRFFVFLLFMSYLLIRGLSPIRR